jgi:hypothetical protein
MTQSKTLLYYGNSLDVLRRLPLEPEGDELRGDVGVLFSDRGGTRTVVRAYYANRQTAIASSGLTGASAAMMCRGMLSQRRESMAPTG